MKIYTHDEAAKIVGLFEDLLFRYDISVPSPEDDERESDDNLGLYGSTYSELLDLVEQSLLDILGTHTATTEIIQGRFSSNGY